eukprot:TRINITY_DN59201_c0_g1_i1.p2 TRINITY_DN59201_c0_g1~~TRINITY_DN59201_c0_g1_i1.p2  ORF type:complete len:251 (+),score=32.89 TRINITY_DN59201_c0_g1_i1:554-1306(+)
MPLPDLDVEGEEEQDGVFDGPPMSPTTVTSQHTAIPPRPPLTPIPHDKTHGAWLGSPMSSPTSGMSPHSFDMMLQHPSENKKERGRSNTLPLPDTYLLDEEGASPQSVRRSPSPRSDPGGATISSFDVAGVSSVTPTSQTSGASSSYDDEDSNGSSRGLYQHNNTYPTWAANNPYWQGGNGNNPYTSPYPSPPRLPHRQPQVVGSPRGGSRHKQHQSSSDGEMTPRQIAKQASAPQFRRVVVGNGRFSNR